MTLKAQDPPLPSLEPKRVPGQDAIVKIITAFHPEAQVYLFGSFAKGTNRDPSDIDIAIDIGRRLGWREMSFLENLFAALPIAQTVDLVDMHAIPESFKQAILKTGVVWKS